VQQAALDGWKKGIAAQIPYPAVLAVGFAFAVYGQYTWQYFTPSLPTVRTHSPGVWIAGLAFVIAGLIWLLAPWRRPQGRWIEAFLAVTLAGWLVRVGLAAFHGDAFDLTVWLYPLLVIMLWTKFPDVGALRSSLLGLGWAGSLLLVWTRVSEISGVVPMAPVAPDLVDFEIRNYWLPLSGFLGPEGRWPGPMGGTAFTGALGALLLVLAIALKCKSSWVFGSIGFLALLLTSSRGAIAGAGVGIAVAVLFGQSRLVGNWSFRKRGAVAFVGALAVMALVVQRNFTLTGRTSFWFDFLELWRDSPIFGVGQSGYLDGPESTAVSGTAHSFYIDELARNGLLGFVFLVLGFAIAFLLAVNAARVKASGPLALILTLFVIGLVNTPFGWLSPSFLWLYYFLGVLWAGSLCEKEKHESGSAMNNPNSAGQFHHSG
jgi:hypothetical protein